MKPLPLLVIKFFNPLIVVKWYSTFELSRQTGLRRTPSSARLSTNGAQEAKGQIYWGTSTRCSSSFWTRTLRVSESNAKCIWAWPSVSKVKTATAGLIERIERIYMKTAAYIIMLALCAGIVVMNYKLNGQPRKEQVYNYKKGLYSAIILAVLTSLIYWLWPRIERISRERQTTDGLTLS